MVSLGVETQRKQNSRVDKQKCVRDSPSFRISQSSSGGTLAQLIVFAKM
jgi:hypothetical protein